MLSVVQIQDAVLLRDLKANHTIQLWINGNRITQANGSDPKIKELRLSDVATLAVLSDRQLNQVYQVRLIKRGVSTGAIALTSTWALSFDNGATRFPCTLLPPIREMQQQGVGWVINLEVQR